jgi:hypothetical protein
MAVVPDDFPSAVVHLSGLQSKQIEPSVAIRLVQASRRALSGCGAAAAVCEDEEVASDQRIR